MTNTNDKPKSRLNHLKQIRPNARTNTNSAKPTEQETSADLAACALDVSNAFPSLKSPTALSVAKVVSECLSRAQVGDAPLSPFSTTVTPATTDPAAIASLCAKYELTFASDGREKPVTQAVLSRLANVSKGTLSSISAGQMHFSVEALEGWRKALALVGAHNRNGGKENSDKENELANSFAHFEEPGVFLDELIEDYQELRSLLPIERIKGFAELHGIELANERFNMNATQYIRSLAHVWREEIVCDLLPQYNESTFYELLQTKTRSHRFSRSFGALVRVVHENMSPFSSTVRYPATNFQTYKQRYSDSAMESGLTSDIILSYCFFTGINPLSMLYWLAGDALRTTYKVVSSNTPSELVRWCGTVSPVEYDKFIDSVMSLSLVSDQTSWVLSLLRSEYVFGKVPDYDEVKDRLGLDATARLDLISEAVNPYRASVKILARNGDEVVNLRAYEAASLSINMNKLHTQLYLNHTLEFIYEWMVSSGASMSANAQEAANNAEGLEEDRIRIGAASALSSTGCHVWPEEHTYNMGSYRPSLMRVVPNAFYGGVELMHSDDID